ncbi:bifunctional [glutamate--ammonia ligase]-adenylyl-L-tyrosine phosphorylase/[glutamate--ammonia-ligase] adenylyltransferase [Parashewanella spongiae]|nr:bifunctional [glutamate--ammonia ligase]-adenylyl-L-tyrosine phosphorylase/[glutamate--ammonia-ligase] adenylyltransferase [Parashewanella spongiae]MCL1078727.1 bifunctional [glutamate--ammonia ligase]-adenylyl-L-tyrosine phosphorylase/[glutamate--ammonia-ligase] adenylyltransferase [Parashewanella spongiae]
MTMDTHSNKPIPTEIQKLADERVEQIRAQQPEIIAKLEPECLVELTAVLGLSDYINHQLQRHPEWITVLVDEVKETDICQFYRFMLQKKLQDVNDEEVTKRVLRDFRNRHMVRIAWQDFMSHGTIKQSLWDISTLAETLIINARDWMYNRLCDQYGTPTDAEGRPQPLLIMGMGKLGGGELNFSSDIDLIFTYPESGQTRGGRRELDNQQFFTRLGQKLIALLDQVTVDGFVYRVDMRLRPYGESGPLVCSFNALEHYYQDQGREWERYALVKARVLGPICQDKKDLIALLRPFIYRRYIDFSAIESLRKMKQLIAQEVRRRQLTDNIKLGAGGIREAEFIVQNFQLIHGGRQPDLRKQNIFLAIESVFNHGFLDYNLMVELRNAYLFLRKSENLLQGLSDMQTQTLPDNRLDWQRICWVLGVDTEQVLRKKIQDVMAKINQQFLNSVGGETEDNEQESWAEQLWEETELEHAQKVLIAQGIEDSELIPALLKWRTHVHKKPIGPRGRDTLDKLMPYMLAEILQHANAIKVFIPVSQVIEQIVCRTTYLELLCENPGARKQLVKLCKASPWIAEQLAEFPMLLDDLIDPKQLYDTTEFDDYHSEIRQYCLRVQDDDMEQQMEALRQFKLSQQLKIAAADITGVLPVIQVSDHLTFLAEAIVEQVVIYAWQQLVFRHGKPSYLVDDEMGFAVIGYGKLGGRELGYGSDLDLVFLHNLTETHSQTDGDKPIDSVRFYVKLAQRIIHLFSTRTSSGELYEVDMRLRPSGASGLLVSEVESFGEYQRQAKTWEQQALVRARCIYGDGALEKQFNAHRRQILQKNRVQPKLAEDVHRMRLKMREHLTKVKPNEFDLKHSDGGIVDIEFIAQFLVLCYSNEYPELAEWSDNIRIFKRLTEIKLLDEARAKVLINSYQYLRGISHRQSLLRTSTIVPQDDELIEYSEPVKEVYQHLLVGEHQAISELDRFSQSDIFQNK